MTRLLWEMNTAEREVWAARPKCPDRCDARQPPAAQPSLALIGLDRRSGLRICSLHSVRIAIKAEQGELN